MSSSANEEAKKEKGRRTEVRVVTQLEFHSEKLLPNGR